MKMNEEALLKVLESYTLICILNILLFLSWAFRKCSIAVKNKCAYLAFYKQATCLLKWPIIFKM